MTTDQNLSSLIGRHLDGVAGVADIVALDQALRTDPEAVRLLVASARLDRALRLTLRPGRGRGAHRPARTLRIRIAAGLAAGVLLALGAWWAGRSPADAPFRHDGSAVVAGDALPTNADIAGGGRVVLAPGAEATADGTARHPVVVLLHGSIDCQVDHRPTEGGFTVRTPYGEVRVVGTRFTVGVGTATEVAVTQGIVQVSSGDQSASVPAGAGARLDDRGPPTVFQPVEEILQAPAAAWTNCSNGSTVQAVDGAPLGMPALRCTWAGTWGWVGMMWPDQPRNWSQASGISVTLLGTGSGRTFVVEILDDAHQPIPPIGHDGCERFGATVLDDRTGWREVRIPFSAFTRRPHQSPTVPDNGFGRTAVHGLSLIGDVHGGTVTVGRIGVY